MFFRVVSQLSISQASVLEEHQADVGRYSWLQALVTRLQSETGVYGGGAPNHVLLNAYLPGEGILPHQVHSTALHLASNFAQEKELINDLFTVPGRSALPPRRLHRVAGSACHTALP